MKYAHTQWVRTLTLLRIPRSFSAIEVLGKVGCLLDCYLCELRIASFKFFGCEECDVAKCEYIFHTLHSVVFIHDEAVSGTVGVVAKAVHAFGGDTGCA